jgi:transposase
MAGKLTRMSQIKQLIRLFQQGKGKKTIARELGISKTTVKSYLNKIETGGLDINSLLTLEEPELEAKLFAGTPSYKEQDRYEHLISLLPDYVKELGKTGVTKYLLWQEYRQENPDGYRHTQFCYHLNQYLRAQKPTMVLNHKAGEKLFIDFAGKPLSYIDKTTGEIIHCQVFVACLPYSDYSFAMAVRSQKVEDFIYALSCCLKHIGGVPQVLVPDNLKSAIVKSNRYEPEVNQVLEDFANHYRTTVSPARVRKPQDKALVENQVKLIYSRVYAKLRNRMFFDIHSLNKAVSEMVLLHNQTRMQQKDYCREEKFISDEKYTLNPLPETVFEIKHYKEYTVAKNNHIQLGEDKHYYSVPFTYISTKVKVVYTRNLVTIYAKGNKIATHLRNYQKGGYTTDREHLCSAHNRYLDRSPGYYLSKARFSKVLHTLFEHIFNQQKHPEQLYRTCEGLLNLCRKTNKDEFDKACQIAIDNHSYSYRFISNILKNKRTCETQQTIDFPLPEHKNIRGAKEYK